MNKTTLNSQEEKHSMLSLRRTTSVPVATRAPITVNFYPRSPCGERHGRRITRKITLTFLSTLSLRRATGNPARRPIGRRHFYPRSPCGERQCARGPLRGKAPFLSTLSLRRATILAPLYNPDIVFLSTLSLRRATSSRRASCSSVEFLSTLSLRRATRAFAVYNPPGGISIHALLAESDRQYRALKQALENFYPRSPCGERRKAIQNA